MRGIGLFGVRPPKGHDDLGLQLSPYVVPPIPAPIPATPSPDVAPSRVERAPVAVTPASSTEAVHASPSAGPKPPWDFRPASRERIAAFQAAQAGSEVTGSGSALAVADEDAANVEVLQDLGDVLAGRSRVNVSVIRYRDDGQHLIQMRVTEPWGRAVTLRVGRGSLAVLQRSLSDAGKRVAAARPKQPKPSRQTG